MPALAQLPCHLPCTAGSLRGRRNAFRSRSACICRAVPNEPGFGPHTPAAPAAAATTRRTLLLGSLAVSAAEAVHPWVATQPQARALTLELVTPEVVPAGPLPARWVYAMCAQACMHAVEGI